MHKQLSILCLLARQTFYKLLLLLLLSSVLQTALFVLLLAGNRTIGLGEAVRGACGIPFLLSFLLTAAGLAAEGCDAGAKTGYTLRRLRVTERAVFLWQWAYGALCFLLLWAAELLTAAALCAVWERMADASVQTEMSVFLAFSSEGLLRGLFPMQDAAVWAVNGLLVLTLGASAAVLSYRQRRGRLGWQLPAACTAAGFAFPNEAGQWQGAGLYYAGMLALVLLALTASAVSDVVLGKEEKDSEGLV